MNINWESDKYKDNFSFVHEYGESVLKLIKMPECEGKPFAIDLGCGNGELTEKLWEMGFDVIGIDDSEQMIKSARALHPDLEFRKGNAIDFTSEKKADVIFSNAVFHWIDKENQLALAQNLFARLRDGGQLVCEFGGKGCAETIHSALECMFASMGFIYPRVFYFPTVGEYASLLESAGFRVETALLFDRPTPQKGEHGLRNWIDMFVKKPFEEVKMDNNRKEMLLVETEEYLRDKLFINGRWIVDYVRIRIRATK